MLIYCFLQKNRFKLPVEFMQTFISSVHLFLDYCGNINCIYFRALKSQLKYLNYLGFVSGKQILRKTSTPMSLFPSPHVRFYFFFFLFKEPFFILLQQVLVVALRLFIGACRLLCSCDVWVLEHKGSVVVVLELSCPTVCGILILWPG